MSFDKLANQLTPEQMKDWCFIVFDFLETKYPWGKGVLDVLKSSVVVAEKEGNTKGVRAVFKDVKALAEGFQKSD